VLLEKLLTERTRLATVSGLHVSSFVSSNIHTISESETVTIAAKIMLEKKAISLLVSGDPLRLLSRRDLARLFVGVTDITVRDLMSPAIYIARYGERLVHLRRIMIEKRLDTVPVYGPRGELVGLISVDDIAWAFVFYHEELPERSRKRARRELRVEDCPLEGPLTVSPEDPASEAAKLLVERGARGVLVVESSKPVGILGVDEFVKALALYA
ncbi:MAG: CBS domain-containing protein, partial [Fervidicoccaceae archaeon]